ncbi:Dolichyl-diphosphooligosaccharide--protein glycosyltransferase subunit 4A-like protein [Drosera capensis]
MRKGEEKGKRKNFLLAMDDQTLGFMANFVGVFVFALVIAYHYVVAEARDKRLGIKINTQDPMLRRLLVIGPYREQLNYDENVRELIVFPMGRISLIFSCF